MSKDRTAVRVNSREQLRAVARKLGMRPDWHEPGERGVTAVVHGDDFDNAGFWGHGPDGKLRAYGPRVRQEMWAELLRDGEPAAEVNLATLLAWACEDAS